MKRLVIIVALASLLTYHKDVSAGPIKDRSHDGTEYTSGGLNDEFVIPDRQLPATAQAALSGDGRAALKLSNYYGLYKGDYQRQRMWLQVAAENGDVLSEKNLSAMLNSELPSRNAEETRFDKQRYCFWLRKAVAGGFPITSVYSGELKECGIHAQ